jgi:hypothetical protein
VNHGWHACILVLDDPRDLVAVFGDELPWAGRCASPARATDGTAAIAQHLVVTADELEQLQVAFGERVKESTPSGFASAQLSFPSIDWQTLGYVAGFEPL